MVDIGRKRVQALITFDIDQDSRFAKLDRDKQADQLAGSIRHGYSYQITFTDFRMTMEPVTDD